MARKRGAGYIVRDNGAWACWIDVRGCIYAATYAPGHFEEMPEEDILDAIRQDYRERPKKFRPFNVSTGYYC